MKIMTTEFLDQCSKPYTGDDLVLWEGDDLPIEAYLGTVYMKSKLGSLLEFTSYWEHDYRPPEYIFMQQKYHVMKIIDVAFHHLARPDKAYFTRWKGFEMYCIDEFHSLLRYLKRCDFQLYIKKYVAPGI